MLIHSFAHACGITSGVPRDPGRVATTHSGRRSRRALLQRHATGATAHVGSSNPSPAVTAPGSLRPRARRLAG